MYGQIVAFLAIVAVAFACNCGQCYSGYGGYVRTPLFLNARVCDSPVVSTPVYTVAPVVATGVCASPVVATRVCASPIVATPYFREAVGCPEVVSSCENSYGPSVVASPVISTGIRTVGECATVC